MIESLKDRIIGRTSFEDVLHPSTGELLARRNEIITEKMADAIMAAEIKEVKVRSVLECNSVHGVCAKCYGRNLATGKGVDIGEAVGIIAAQSIGEPGTQLTMRTFHSGGIAGTGITQGLPRVEELFEARKPKGLATITKNGGTVSIQDNKKRQDVVVTSDDGHQETYAIPFGTTIAVHDGDVIAKGDRLTEGSLNPHDILDVLGVKAVQDYITREVQKVYRIQGVDIDDRHIEIIIKQMLQRVRITESGDSSFLPGQMVNHRLVALENEQLEAEGKEPASFEYEILGITKASIASESFLSAASFQETTRVLTDASIKGKVDDLRGLKENIIIGQLIPAGTGMKSYRQSGITYDGMKDDLERIEGMKAEKRAPHYAEDVAMDEEDENTVEVEDTDAPETVATAAREDDAALLAQRSKPRPTR